MAADKRPNDEHVDAAPFEPDTDAGWSTCPGCGLSLPGRPGALRGGASEACWQLYGEVTGFELNHLATLGRLHQLTVDAYNAQHAGGASTLSVSFALIGLHLALDEGWRGDQVRAAHQALAAAGSTWPQLGPVPPPGAAPLTVYDLALASSPAEHEQLVEAWARAVWGSWSRSQPAVRALTGERLPPPVAGRIRALP